jgi:hypothetical protein
VIDFRYHLVSLAAVFLALAVGVVLGAGPLGDTLGHNLQKQNKVLTASQQQLQTTVSQLQKQSGYAETVDGTLLAPTLAGRLTGTRVVVVILPGASPTVVTLLGKALGLAGATVTGQVKLSAAYVDPSKSSVVGDLATQLAPSGVELPTTGPYDAAGYVLADALLSRERLLLGRPDNNSVALLSGYRQAGLLTSTADVDQRASVALVVAPGAPTKITRGSAGATAALLSLVSALANAGRGVLVAGPSGSADPGSLVRAIRDDSTLHTTLSTEDSANLASGQIGAILGLAAQAAGVVGHYGSGPGSTAALPSITVGSSSSP